jgi:hypothetical protein
MLQVLTEGVAHALKLERWMPNEVMQGVQQKPESFEYET